MRCLASAKDKPRKRYNSARPATHRTRLLLGGGCCVCLTGQSARSGKLAKPGGKLRLRSCVSAAAQQPGPPPSDRAARADRPRDDGSRHGVDQCRQHHWPPVLQVDREDEVGVPAVVPAREGQVAPAELAPDVPRLVAGEQREMPPPLTAAPQRAAACVPGSASVARMARNTRFARAARAPRATAPR